MSDKKVVDSRSKPFPIKVKTRDSNVKELDIESGWSIPKLKTELEKVTGIPGSSQRLIYMGKVLKDDHTIGDYGIKENDTIHLVAKPPGTGSEGSTSAGPDSQHHREDSGAQSTTTYTYNFQPSPQHQGQLMMGTVTVPEGQAVPDLNTILRGVLSGLGGAAPQALHIQTSTGPLNFGGGGSPFGGGGSPFMMFPQPGSHMPGGPAPNVPAAAMPTASSAANFSSQNPSFPNAPASVSPSSSSNPVPQTMPSQVSMTASPQQQALPPHVHNVVPIIISPPRPSISSVSLHIHATPADLEQLPARLDRLAQQIAFQNMSSPATNFGSWRASQLQGFPMDIGGPPIHPMFNPVDTTPLQPPQQPMTATVQLGSSGGSVPLHTDAQHTRNSEDASTPSHTTTRPSAGPSFATAISGRQEVGGQSQAAASAGSMIQQGSAVVGGILQTLSPMMQQLVSGVQRATASATPSRSPVPNEGSASTSYGTEPVDQSASSAASTPAQRGESAVPSGGDILIRRIMDSVGLPEMMTVMGGDWTPMEKAEAPIQEFLLEELERQADKSGREPLGEENIDVWCEACSSALVSNVQQSPITERLRHHIDDYDAFLQQCQVLLPSHLKDFVNLSINAQRGHGETFSEAVKRWWIGFVGPMVQIIVQRCQAQSAAEACIQTLVARAFEALGQRHANFAAISFLGSPMATQFIMNCYKNFCSSSPTEGTNNGRTEAHEDGHSGPATTENRSASEGSGALNVEGSASSSAQRRDEPPFPPRTPPSTD